jgi:lipopolysaccharide export system protein LptC
MSRQLSILLPFTLLACLTAATFWLEQTSQPVAAVIDDVPKHDPDTIVRNFSAARMDETGSPDYTLAAEEMRHYPGDDSTRLTSPRLSHLGAGKPPIHVRSQEGVVSKDGENIYLRDDVEVTREAQGKDTALTLTTNYLHVIPEKNIARTPEPVVISNDELRVTAVGMELNSETRTLELHSRVKGRYDERQTK